MLKTEDKNNKFVISLDGKLDSLNASEIFENIQNLIKDKTGDIVLDFENLEYISSAGLQVVLMCAKNRQEKNKKVYIYKPQEAVDEVINISGFYNFIEKTDTI